MVNQFNEAHGCIQKLEEQHGNNDNVEILDYKLLIGKVVASSMKSLKKRTRWMYDKEDPTTKKNWLIINV